MIRESKEWFGLLIKKQDFKCNEKYGEVFFQVCSRIFWILFHNCKFDIFFNLYVVGSTGQRSDQTSKLNKTNHLTEKFDSHNGAKTPNNAKDETSHKIYFY